MQVKLIKKSRSSLYEFRLEYFKINYDHNSFILKKSFFMATRMVRGLFIGQLLKRSFSFRHHSAAIFFSSAVIEILVLSAEISFSHFSSYLAMLMISSSFFSNYASDRKPLTISIYCQV